MTRIALVLALVPACAEPLPVHVRDHDDLPAAVVEACDMLGLACEYSAQRYGAIDLRLRLVPRDAEGGQVMGSADDDAPCRPSAWVDPRRPERVAHEIGHTLGLEHVDDNGNLMAPVHPGDELADEQFNTLERSAGLLVACR